MTDIQITNRYWDDEEEVLHPENFAVHPGLILKSSIIPAAGLTAMALADRLGVARPGFNNMLNGKRAITPALALKIQRAINYPASLLVTMQAAHDLAAATHSAEVMRDVESIEPLLQSV